MRVAVVGAGIAGTMTAYELAVDGHEVTVFERRAGVATEASFAHAGLLSPGYLVPWSLPGEAGGPAPGKLLGRLFSQRNAGSSLQDAVRVQLHRLGRYSRERLEGLQQALQLDCEQHSGLLVLLRDKAALVSARPALKMLTDLGERFHLVDANRARELEPGLNPDMALQAAVELPDDSVANGRLFTQQIKTEAQRLGVRFLLDHEVQRIGAGKPVTLQSRGPAGCEGPPDSFDAVVLCAALGAGPLLAPLGLKLPLAATWGYSVTAPLRMREHAFDMGPRTALVDQRHQVSISRLGDRVRVAGGIETEGAPERVRTETLAQLYRVLEDWFPGAAQAVRAQEWRGCRAGLPDGVPLLGQSGQAGVWLNLGHGSNGWALACGSARLLADRLSGRPGAMALDGFEPARLR